MNERELRVREKMGERRGKTEKAMQRDKLRECEMVPHMRIYSDIALGVVFVVWLCELT